VPIHEVTRSGIHARRWRAPTGERVQTAWRGRMSSATCI